MSLYQSISSSATGSDAASQPINRLIDHTLLKNDATEAELARLCQEAIDYEFASVCVNSYNIPFVVKYLKDHQTASDDEPYFLDHPTARPLYDREDMRSQLPDKPKHLVMPIAVIGFPLGAAATEVKAFEARCATKAGALEIDMVINIGALKDQKYDVVYSDIQAVVEASHPAAVKVIIETAALNEQQKIIACSLAKAAKAAFVKTCTGFGGGGACVADIELMRRIVGHDIGVKASGAVRSYEDAMKMVKAGASRIGTSSGVAIAQAAKSNPSLSQSTTDTPKNTQVDAY